MSTPFPPRRFRDLCPAVGTHPGPVRGGRHRRLSRRARVRRRSACGRPGHRPRRRRLPRPGGAAAPRLARAGTRGAAVAVRVAGASRRSMRRPASPNASSPPSALPRPDARGAAATSCSPAWTGSGTRWPPASSERCCACTTGGSRSSGRACRRCTWCRSCTSRGPTSSRSAPHCRPASRRRGTRSSPRSAPGRRYWPGAPDSVRTAASPAGSASTHGRPRPRTAWRCSTACPGRSPSRPAPATPARRPSTWGCGSGAGGW